MPSITFKAKPVHMFTADEVLAYKYVQVPAIKRHHCDMAGFRKHPKYSPYANSDLFLSMVKREFYKRGLKTVIRLDQIPEGVTIDASGFLASVTIDLD